MSARCRRVHSALVAAVVAVACLTWRQPADAQHALDESRLKAIFVFRFPQWAEWPSYALEGRPTFEYCVSPPNPYGVLLREIVAGEAIGGRALVVRELTPTSSLSTCHVLFVPGADGRPLIDRIGSLPVLTVGDSPRFLDDGGMIQLIRSGNHVRFNINVPAAERAGLRMSSHLLGLAENLRKDRR